MAHYVGVDVGTTSVRAAVIEQRKNKVSVIRSCVVPIQTWTEDEVPDNFEQSSSDIWNALALAVKSAVNLSGLASGDIKGIGFDATCSLVVLDKHFSPIGISSVTNEEDPRRSNERLVMFLPFYLNHFYIFSLH